MRDDGQVDRAILRDDLVEPDFRIVVGIPAGGDVLGPSRRRHENTVDAERFAVARGLDRFVRGDCPGAGDDRHLPVHLLHRNFQHAPLFLAGEIKNLAGFRIDAEAPAHADEFLVFQEVLEETAIGGAGGEALLVFGEAPLQ